MSLVGLYRNTERNGPETALLVGRRPLPAPHMLPSVLPREVDVQSCLFVLVQWYVPIALGLLVEGVEVAWGAASFTGALVSYAIVCQ